MVKMIILKGVNTSISEKEIVDKLIKFKEGSIHTYRIENFRRKGKIVQIRFSPGGIQSFDTEEFYDYIRDNTFSDGSHCRAATR